MATPTGASSPSPSLHTYNKAIAAALAAGFTLITAFGVDVSRWSGPEITGALSTLLGVVLVYLIPNRDN